MSTRLDLEKPIYLGPKAAKENSVVDHFRRAVSTLDEGGGVPYAKLEEYLLKNFTPGKSAAYGPSFIRSYVRDAVKEKDGFLSHENTSATYSSTPVGTPRSREAKPKRISKSARENAEILLFIRDAGEVADASDVDNTQITPQDLVSELGRKRKTVDTKVEEFEKEGLLRTEVNESPSGDVTYVYLTAAGLARANEVDPKGADSAPGAAEGAAEA
jgi:DNA-binding MarR family transcriptional regulator